MFLARRRRKFCIFRAFITIFPVFIEEFRSKFGKFPIFLPWRMEKFSARWQFLKISPFQMEKKNPAPYYFLQRFIIMGKVWSTDRTGVQAARKRYSAQRNWFFRSAKLIKKNCSWKKSRSFNQCRLRASWVPVLAFCHLLHWFQHKLAELHLSTHRWLAEGFRKRKSRGREVPLRSIVRIASTMTVVQSLGSIVFFFGPPKISYFDHIVGGSKNFLLWPPKTPKTLQKKFRLRRTLKTSYVFFRLRRAPKTKKYEEFSRSRKYFPPILPPSLSSSLCSLFLN